MDKLTTHYSINHIKTAVEHTMPKDQASSQQRQEIEDLQELRAQREKLVEVSYEVEDHLKKRLQAPKQQGLKTPLGQQQKLTESVQRTSKPLEEHSVPASSRNQQDVEELLHDLKTERDKLVEVSYEVEDQLKQQRLKAPQRSIDNNLRPNTEKTLKPVVVSKDKENLLVQEEIEELLQELKAERDHLVSLSKKIEDQLKQQLQNLKQQRLDMLPKEQPKSEDFVKISPKSSDPPQSTLKFPDSKKITSDPPTEKPLHIIPLSSTVTPSISADKEPNENINLDMNKGEEGSLRRSITLQSEVSIASSKVADQDPQVAEKSTDQKSQVAEKLAEPNENNKADNVGMNKGKEASLKTSATLQSEVSIANSEIADQDPQVAVKFADQEPQVEEKSTESPLSTAVEDKVSSEVPHKEDDGPPSKVPPPIENKIQIEKSESLKSGSNSTIEKISEGPLSSTATKLQSREIPPPLSGPAPHLVQQLVTRFNNLEESMNEEMQSIDTKQHVLENKSVALKQN